MGTITSLTFASTLSTSWKLVKKHLWFFFPLVALYLIIMAGPHSIDIIVERNTSPFLSYLGMLLQLGFWILEVLVGIGIIMISLAIVDKEKIDQTMFLGKQEFFLRLLVGNILYALIVFCGLLLFIIPGIYLGIKYQFFSFCIVDKHMGLMDEFGESARLTKGYKQRLFLINCGLFCVVLAGFLLLFVGSFLTIPLSWVATAYVYRLLEQK